jgi:hypothetical protein
MQWPLQNKSYLINLFLLSFILQNFIIMNIPYLRVYKQHFFHKNLPSKTGVRLIHGFLEKLYPPKRSHYSIDDWACDASIVCCETPSRDHYRLGLLSCKLCCFYLCKLLHMWRHQRITGISVCIDYMRVADTIDSQKSEDSDITDKLL